MERRSRHSIRKNILSLLVGSVLSIGFCQESQAQYFSGGFPPDVVRDLRWTAPLTSSLTEQYLKNNVINEALQWNNISSKVKLTRVKSGTYHIKVLTAIGRQDRILAEVTPYCKKFKFEFWEDCSSKVWSIARITGYENEMTRAFKNSIANRASTYLHEFGHALSLAHVEDLGERSIMYPSFDTYTPDFTMNVYAPGIIDKRNLKEKWGK